MLDDEIPAAQTVRRALELGLSSQLAFRHCDDSREALKAALEFSPDLVLLDLNMPEIDGLTMLQQMRTEPALREVPIIILSGEEMPETKRQAFELGATDYLVKFPSAIELIARIRAHAAAYRHKVERDEACTALVAAKLKLEETLDCLRDEEKKSERLLLNIMPQAIADRLRRGDATIADHHPAVTVVFTDIVSFSRISRSISPAELVRLLDKVFSRLDLLASEFGLEKIKTIGDAFLAVAGLPFRREDHCQACADFALRALQESSRISNDVGSSIEFRIGMHTGPVVAGVIGHNRLSYDLWGDTVNVASRMESYGEPGKIQVTEAVRENLKSDFHLTSRGPIELRGIGTMPTYWLGPRMARG